MIKANFDAYDSYVTDSLYQWDLNQVLTVTGLNLTVAPEIHFHNANMERAIVRQSTMENHVVSVGIPNSLLQEPLTIKVDIGIYEGDLFKVIEKVSIPVKPKLRPSDYRLEDTDEEIYSFNRLENMIEQIDEKWSAFTTMQVDEAVNEWLTDHPEATTTVQDKSLTIDKMVAGTLGYVTPQMFGAKGDGVTDDTSAIRSAVKLCEDNDKSFYLPIGDYVTSETIDLSNVKTVEFDGVIIYMGDGVAIRVNAQSRTANYKHRLSVRNYNRRHTGTGILLQNIGCSYFDISAEGFEIGCELMGDGEGCGYNTIYPRQIVSNHIGLKLNSKNGGWCNQNVFNSGRIFKWSTDTFDLTGILITSEYGYYSNSNVFYSINLEGNCKYAIKIEYGQYNRFYEIRNEGCETTLLESNESMANTIIVSYGANDVLTNNGDYIGSHIETLRNRHLPKYKQILNNENVKRKVYATSNRVTSSLFKIMTYEGAKDVVPTGNIKIDGDYVYSTSFPCLALKLDPTVGNRYYIKLNCKDDYTGRFAIVAYNSNGDLITSYPIKTRVNEKMSLINGSNGFTYFQTQVDGKDSIEFEVTDSNISELYVFFKGGTKALYLKGLTVYATDKGAIINDVNPQLNGSPTNKGDHGDIVKSTLDDTTAWVMLDKWYPITL